jgi:hypothetical protein
MNRNNKLSATEKLLHDKALLESLIKERENNLSRDFAYIRDNASSLMFSGFTSLFFPSDKSKTNKEQLALSSCEKREKPLAVSDWLAIGKGFVPVVWEIAQPFVLTWGINKAKSWFAGLFTKTKKKSKN